MEIDYKFDDLDFMRKNFSKIMSDLEKLAQLPPSEEASKKARMLEGEVNETEIAVKHSSSLPHYEVREYYNDGKRKGHLKTTNYWQKQIEELP